MKCSNMEEIGKIKKCADCIWCITQPNKENMIHCKFLGCGVYAGSMACSHFEPYDPKNRPF